MTDSPNIYFMSDNSISNEQDFYVILSIYNLKFGANFH